MEVDVLHHGGEEWTEPTWQDGLYECGDDHGGDEYDQCSGYEHDYHDTVPVWQFTYKGKRHGKPEQK